MLQPAPTPDAESGTIEHSLWALVDLIVFGLVFIAAMFTIIFPLANLPITYLIPLQGFFDAVLVGFAAFWVSVVRRNSFKDFIHFYRNLTFKPLYLAVLGTGLALSVVVVSAFLPSAGPSPLEKMLNSKSAILVFGIFGVVVAPLLEEIIFRGFLYQVFSEIGSSRLATAVMAFGVAAIGFLASALAGRLKSTWVLLILLAALICGLREVWGPRVTVILTAALFALLHAGQLAGNLGYVALIFVVGCILALIRERSNSILASSVVHMSYNSTLFVLFGLSSLLQKFTK